MAQDIFLYIDGIPGESKKKNVEGWIELFSFSNGIQNHSTVSHGGGSGAGKADLSSINCTKMLDMASPKLFLNCAKGTHVDKGTMVVRESTGDATTQIYYQYDFKELFIDSVNWSGADGGGKPSEALSFSYNQLTITYWPQNADGTLGSPIVVGWNVSTNTQV
jgi:type VI secretion system secreted protein Hcp